MDLNPTLELKLEPEPGHSSSSSLSSSVRLGKSKILFTNKKMKKELLVLGANGALGKGAVSVFLKKNYDKIYLFGSSLDDIENAKAEKIITGDLSNEENVIRAFTSVTPAKDKLLFLFSAAGGFAGGKFVWETSLEEWNKMMDLNLNLSFLVAKHFAKLVKESAGGAICFTAAYTGLHPESKKSAYGVSKSGLIHLVKSLAMEGHEINLAINAIAPYIIDTKANREWMQNAKYDSWIKPEEIAELADNLFGNFNFVSGNILELKSRFEIPGV